MKCFFCKRDLDNDNSIEPIENSHNYKCCNTCNKKLVIPVRNFYDFEIRKLQYTKEFSGDWYSASKKLFEGKSVREICDPIEECKNYLNDIDYKEDIK